MGYKLIRLGDLVDPFTKVIRFGGKRVELIFEKGRVAKIVLHSQL